MLCNNRDVALWCGNTGYGNMASAVATRHLSPMGLFHVQDDFIGLLVSTASEPNTSSASASKHNVAGNIVDKSPQCRDLASFLVEVLLAVSSLTACSFAPHLVLLCRAAGTLGTSPRRDVVKVHWLYRMHETGVTAPSFSPMELLSSDHSDTIPVASVNGKVNVLLLESPADVSHAFATHPDFIRESTCTCVHAAAPHAALGLTA